MGGKSRDDAMGNASPVSSCCLARRNAVSQIYLSTQKMTFRPGIQDQILIPFPQKKHSTVFATRLNENYKIYSIYRTVHYLTSFFKSFGSYM